MSGHGWKRLKSHNVIKCTQCDKLFSAEKYMTIYAGKSTTKEMKVTPEPLKLGSVKIPSLQCDTKCYTEIELTDKIGIVMNVI